MAETEAERDRKRREDLITLLALIWLLGYNGAAESVGLEVQGDPSIMARAWAEGRVGDLLVGLDKTTDGRVSKLATQAVENGQSFSDFLDSLADAHIISPARAKLIARTEFVRARNIGQATALMHAGVTKVRITDGVLWDRPCIEANNAVWGIVRYLMNPIQHPACIRGISGVVA